MSEGSLREQRREQRRALSRDQILDAAEQVFARNGFHDASLREIAELAEFSVGAVYSFFEGKDDIYRAIFLRRGTAFMPEMREVLGSEVAPLRQLLDLAAWQVSFFRRYPDWGRLVLREGAIAAPLTTPDGDAQIQQNFAAAQQAQAELFRRGQQAGDLRSGTPDVLARMFSGLVSAFQAADLSTDPSVPLRLADLLDVIEAAFAAPCGALRFPGGPGREA
jgi:TetR/AcrR family transcriptional regulator